MKAASSGLAAHIALGQTTLASCYRVTRTDGVTQGFTDHDQDLVIDGVTYMASSGFSKFNLTDKSNLEMSQMQVDGMINAGMTAADLRARKYDYADVQIFAVNWANLSQGKIILLTGKFGPVTINEYGFQVELNGMAARLSNVRGDLYQPSCRVDLGSTECGVDVDSLMQSGTVATTDGARNLTATGLSAADTYFAGGLLTWLTGNNTGDSVEVRSWTSGGAALVLYLKARAAIVVGDTFKVQPGCDKLFSTCRDKFSNIVNFRGEPYIPGTDYLLTIPDYKGPQN
jgi:uncharacterized phage protein (TIGR02218 family)